MATFYSNLQVTLSATTTLPYRENLWFLLDILCFMTVPTYVHRSLSLKLDIQPRSHLVVEVCIQRGMCTVTNPLQHGTPPPPGVMPRSLLE